MRILCTSLIGGLLLPVSLAFGGTRIGFGKDVQILQSDDKGITLEFTPQYFRLDTLTVGGRVYTDFQFFGATSAGLENVGQPDLKHRVLSIAFPSEVGNSIKVIGVENEEVRDVVLPPVPRFVRDESSFGANRIYEENGEAYRMSQFVPASIVGLGRIGHSRSMITGTVNIYPIQYNPASGVVRMYTKIVLRISFGSGGRRASKPVEDELVKSSILNYDVAKHWSVESPRVLGTTGIISSVLASGDWYRIEVKDDGFYRLDATALTSAGINLSQVDPRTIKIYGNGGLELPQGITAARPVDLVENAIFVSGESDGKFDSGDFVLFYGRSVRGWKYDPVTKSFSHYLNHYTESNYYWLTYGGTQGKRMASLQSLNDPNPLVPPKFVGKLALEEEKTKTIVNSGLEWYGQSFDSKNMVAVISNKLDGLIASDPIKYRFVFVAHSDNYSSFTVEDNGVGLGSVSIPPITEGDIVGYYALKSPVLTFQRPGDVPDSRSLVRITYSSTSTNALGFLDWMEIFYSHDYSAVNDLLHFTSPDTDAIVQYNLQNFSTSGVLVFDVTDYSNVEMIANSSISGGSLEFQAQQSHGSVSEYFAVGPNGYKTPVGIQKMGNSNLHGFSDGAEFVIISHNDFLAEAQRLKEYREQAGPDALSTYVADVQDVYNEFSGGLLDPTAIRDFLKYAYDNWKVKPRYVLLFGDGDYDYKNILSQDKNWIPPYETPETLVQINSYCTDDYFAEVSGNDQIVDLAVGRIPVRSADEARVVVDKIIAYENSVVFDPWKNLITFVADDGLTSTGDDGSIHTGQAEELAEVYTPDEFEKAKIYLVEYPTVNAAEGRRKPDAAKAIIDQINGGTLIINWTGHGNSEVWAHERVFQRETTIPQLVNKDKLTFVVAATCDFGRYDLPTDQSATEVLLVRENGGSIGTLTSTRAAYSPLNAAFNADFFTHLLARDAQRKLSRLGDAVFATKQTHYGVNDQKFHLFGDPTLRLCAPTYQGQIDSINGNPASIAVQLKALGKGKIEGSIRKLDDSVWSDYSGKLLMTVYDSRKEVPVPDWPGFTFTVSGGIIYKGENTIANGVFSGSFYVPKDISYENNNGRVTVYFSNGNSDGAGFTENVVIGGTDSTVMADVQGPSISVYLDSRSFRPGDLVGESPLLLVDYFDEHGINTASGGIGHRLEARIDDQSTAIDLSDFYKGKADSYQEGSVEYQLSDLSDGKHVVTAKAWDVYNNSSTIQTTFEVASTSELHISNVFNYPNPFAQATTFTFQQNQSSPIDVEIKIYTLAGRVVRVLRSPSVVDRFVRIGWDGRDEDGDPLANGVYLYRVVAHTADRGKTTETIGKLSVLR
jgi:flagellar hook assembly protein FlgD